jgi:peroxiredoxin Q/BCP
LQLFINPDVLVRKQKFTKMKQVLFSLFAILISAGFTHSQNSKVLSVGDKAPTFKATADDGSTWNINDYKGKKNIVVYFYPAAMTGGCTKQACAYRDAQPAIESANAVVVGISGDNVEGLKLFKQVENLNFALLSDESGQIAGKFGVPTRDGGTVTKEINGQNVNLMRGITTSRWTFIIDKTGKIAYKNEQVDAAKDAEMVLSFLKKEE